MMLDAGRLIQGKNAAFPSGLLPASTIMYLEFRNLHLPSSIQIAGSTIQQGPLGHLPYEIPVRDSESVFHWVAPTVTI
jgi:hypothetical protein